MHTETITWHEVAEQMPDADMTVLIRLADDESEPVWLGWWDGERWYDALGTVVEMVRWAEMPVGDAQ